MINRNWVLRVVSASCLSGAFILVGIAATNPGECCKPASININDPPTPPPGATCAFKQTREGFNLLWTCINGTCAGQANQNALNGECQISTPDDECTDGQTAAVPGAQCGTFSCPNVSKLNGPPDGCFCSWSASMPQPDGCPVTIQGVPNCSGSQCPPE